jgi:mannose-6-phosphate isomerase-like protein (cupin superfamily)
MKIYKVNDVHQEQKEQGQRWREFLRVPDLSVGVYHLKAGEKDPQLPHSEDEVYYILSGRGQIHVSGEDQPVTPDTLVYVAKQEIHYFHTIEEDLVILVFFAPAEGSQIDAYA